MTLNEQDNKLLVRFSFNDNRLCISMHVLYALSSPNWIQVLISADRKTMFIKGCDETTRDRFSVPARVYTDSSYKYRLRKAAFKEAVCNAQNWDENGKYRLFGHVIADGVIGFIFADAVRLDGVSALDD
ncbi:hypothetical protein FACS18949_02340 [Clostridia bacterium]|nr:hypothetical protein FACS18949_02340 [Clostridia bacterium]